MARVAGGDGDGAPGPTPKDRAVGIGKVDLPTEIF